MGPMTALSRRNVLKGAIAAAGAAAVAPSLVVPAHAAGPAAVPLVRNRLTLPSGISTGDVTTNSGVLWSRASGAGRMVANLLAVDEDGSPLRGSRAFRRVLRGTTASDATDFTSKIHARDLPSGTQFALTMHFEDPDGNAGDAARGSFSTAPGSKANSRWSRSGGTERGQSFVWTGDTAGQGWGINEDIGGMRGYAAMLAIKPDFFIHSGDTIYADGPIAAQVIEPDGQIWRNLVTEEVSKVAETLEEYRGRHRYNLMDKNIRALYAEVPVIAQWDDHETTNNWYPGEILTDSRYTERRVDVLAARGRQAWQEYQPIAQLSDGSTGFEPARIYRKISRGPQLDVFCLDMRTFKDPSTDGKETRLTHILGQEQADWLIREVSKSRATWKVISADLPLGIIVPDGPAAQESLANHDAGAPLGKELEIARVLSAFKRNRVKNVVWLTADVHYCAAHHYSPERAAFQDFDPFWEFVGGPINAGSFGPNQMDGTFGPEVVFSRAGAYAGESPRSGESQYFGHVDLGEDDVFSVTLRNANGMVIFRKDLNPER
ncbi:alkaline phosphatase D family protein [Arthrobacter globiformis]|uniref:alkaline phosphatase D family protein n=1 Tax=Arthrobacter globiformis TaxID=1665 RepID=UPI00278F0065|nr:alkaline phosphatase D family protein [Arthrobacter globiformis]MDQ0617446.1 alkaline phosphatase D [Arthrobacter globiformis]